MSNEDLRDGQFRQALRRSMRSSWLSIAVAISMVPFLADGCSVERREADNLRHPADAGAGGDSTSPGGATFEAGSTSKAGAASEGGATSEGGSTSKAGATSEGGSTEGGTADGGSAGSGEAAGASGAVGECSPLDGRTCRDGGALGACASGKQTCDQLGSWGKCSIVPAAADTCERGNDATCNGIVNEGCPCVRGATRSCADAGLVGKCATGTQTCSETGAWSACSIAPASEDTCAPGNNDNCSGAANEGCACVLGSIRACGACLDGTQTCTNGKTGQYSTCTGAALVPTTYYRDADGDGFGSSATATSCNATPPAGYSDQTGDCCDDAVNVAIAKQIHPGQTEFFVTPAGSCGIVWDYNCSGRAENDRPAGQEQGCSTSSTPPNCMGTAKPFPESSCGTIASSLLCIEVPNPPLANVCKEHATGGTLGCH